VSTPAPTEPADENVEPSVDRSIRYPVALLTADHWMESADDVFDVNDMDPTACSLVLPEITVDTESP